MNSTAYTSLLTSSGRQRIREEQARLRERQAAAASRLKQELQDRDDLTWYVTQEELGQIQGRLDELQVALSIESKAQVPSEDGAVRAGSRVIVQDESGREQAFLIVAPLEVDAAKGRISFDSPVGAALMGRRAGDSVTVVVPRGQRQFSVLHVEDFPGGA